MEGVGAEVNEVSCVHRGKRIAVMEDGQVLPVTHLFDRFGDDTDDDNEAVACVAGPDSAGAWFSIDLTAFDGGPLQ